MKITRRQLQRIIREAQRERSPESESLEHSIGQLMADPIGAPENFLSGFMMGIDIGVIQVLDRITKDQFPGSLEQYTVIIPDTIRARFEGLAHRTRDIVHPFRIILMGYPYIKIVINR